MIHIEHATNKFIHTLIGCVLKDVWKVVYRMTLSPPYIFLLLIIPLVVPQRHHNGILFTVNNKGGYAAIVNFNRSKGIGLNIGESIEDILESSLLFRSLTLSRPLSFTLDPIQHSVFFQRVPRSSFRQFSQRRIHNNIAGLHKFHWEKINLLIRESPFS